jgi:hypothetical protein
MDCGFVRSVQDFEKTVQIGQTPESRFLEFKQTVNCNRDGWMIELARDISQFANTDGGCLLIGIEETVEPTTRLGVATCIRPVADANHIRGWVEQAIANHLVPSTLSREVSFIELKEGTLVAVNVYPSRNTVFVWHRDKHTMECLHRTNHGKAWMNPDEMERHMMNGSRARRLAFESAREKAISKNTVEIVGGVWQRRNGNLHRIDQPDFVGDLTEEHDDCFELLGTVHASNPPERLNVAIPFDLVRSAWVDSGGKLCVLLDVRLMCARKALTFEALAA